MAGKMCPRCGEQTFFQTPTFDKSNLKCFKITLNSFYISRIRRDQGYRLLLKLYFHSICNINFLILLLYLAYLLCTLL